MSDRDGSGPEDSSNDGVDADFIDVEGLALDYEDHERLKFLLHGQQFRTLAYADRRYLVLGEGDDSDAAARRMTVYRRLDNRPDTTAFRLEGLC